MTEKEKCAAGLLYNANYDQELIQERIAAKDLCGEYNHIKNSDMEGRMSLLKKNTGENRRKHLYRTQLLV